MASRMFENLNAIVANTLTDSIKMIDIDALHGSKDNFFQVDRIEEFADTILGQGGVKDNLVVRPLESGGYEIISGHRRRAAVRLLLDRGENISRLLPCLVQNYTDEDTKLLDIVLMNVSARQISDAEMWRSYEIVDRILKDKKDKGEKFGRIREKLAEILGVSSAQIGKMQNVKNNAIQPVVDAVQNGEISISTANEIAKLDAAEQEKLVQEDISNVSHKEVKQKNETARADKQEKSEKVDTCSTKSEPDPEPVKVDTYSTFSKFIYEKYYDIEEIIEDCMEMSYNEEDEEYGILKELLPMLRQIKEEFREKIRLGI